MTAATAVERYGALAGAQSPYVQKQAVNVGTAERVVSILSGAILLGTGIYAGVRRYWWGVGVSALGGVDLLYRGITGHSALYRALSYSSAGKAEVRGGGVERAVTINKSATDLYAFWRNLENLPRFMRHLDSITVNGPGRSHWVAKAPLGQRVAWDAEITEDAPDHKLAWRSQPGAQVFSTGMVTFTPAPGNRGTVVKASFVYRPPAGAAGALFAKVFGEEPAQQVALDLRQFKELMETGEIAQTTGQPAGRGSKQ
jgi:uncharacterized membrane protein